MHKPENEKLIARVASFHNLSPKNKIFRIREKLQKTKFLQSDIDDFLSTQNIERKLSSKINHTSQQQFKAYDIVDQDE